MAKKPVAEKKPSLVEQSEYKGNPILVLRRSVEDKFPFQFGVGKAELVLRHLKAIQSFVEEHGEVPA